MKALSITARAEASLPQDDEDERWPSLVERFEAQMRPFDDAELEQAKQPHPHAFELGDCGLAPIGEVTILAAPGREGKTFAAVSLSVSYILGTQVCGLVPQANRRVLIYSAEDDRRQYARKVLAHLWRLGVDDRTRVQERLIVPDLTAPGMEPFEALVHVIERKPVASLAIDAVIDALRPQMAESAPPGLLIFETASTLSEAEEDNAAFRTMIKALRRLARELQVACVLVHHTSQAASNNLPDLNVGVGDIRGGTALVFNARQCFLLVNLGSDEDPFPEQDARTVLRGMAAPHAGGRVTALLCLDSSKAIDPPPVFFQWNNTQYGPALSVLPVPPSLEGARWRKLHQMLRGERAERKQEAKEQARSGVVQQVVSIVAALSRGGRKATVNAVSLEAGRSPGWAKPHLELAAVRGELLRVVEPVPRAGKVAVYRLPHPSEVEQ